MTEKKLVYKLNKNFYILFFTTIILLCFSLASIAFGYYKAKVTGESTAQTGTIGVLNINYASRTDRIEITNANPIYEQGYRDNADHIDFEINGTGNTLVGCYKLELFIEYIDESLKDETFRWILYDNNSGEPLTGGSFLNANENSTVVLLSEQQLLPTTNSSYSLYIFLANSITKNQINMLGTSFRGRIIGTGSYVTCNPTRNPIITFDATENNATRYEGGNTFTATISGKNLGTLNCLSSNPGAATCAMNGNGLTIHPIAAGNTLVTITEANPNQTIQYNITVLPVNISLSSYSGIVYRGGINTTTATISGTNMGTLSCSMVPISTSVASCSINGNTLTVTAGNTTGTVIARVNESNGNKTVDYTVETQNQTYTLTYDSNEGSECLTKSITYGSTYGTLCTPNRQGYQFKGWFSSELNNNGNGTEVTSGTTIITTSNHALYAKWTANEYTLNLTAVTGATYAVTGCTTVTAGEKYTCTYGASVKVTATAASGYTVSSTLTGTNISNKTNGTAFSMPIPTSGTAVTLTATVSTIPLKSKILLDNVEIADSSVDFSVNNESGLYYNATSTYGENNTIIYYYRGNVNNNWVSFGGYKWRILRTTSEGGVKLVYAGTGSTGLTNMLPTTANYTNFSTVINNWYTTWIASQPTVPNYLSTTAIYCHDKTVSSTNSGNTQTCGYSYTYYNSRSMPTYVCASSCAYSVQNGNLSYPINTLSKDEAIFSGVASNGISFLKVGGNSVNNHILTTTISSNGGCYNAALGTSTAYYTIMESSSYITTSSAGSSCANTPLRCSYTSGYIRPVIALKACVKYSGGLGTTASPYTISTTGC